MGKTRLLQEFMSTVSDVVKVRGRAEPYGAATPYRPVRQPLRELLGLTTPESSTLPQALTATVSADAPQLLPWLPLIGDVIGVPVPETDRTRDLDPQFRPDRTADAVVTLLEAFSPGPLVLAIDDSHYADDATSTLLGRVGRETRTRPWLLLLTRSDGTDGAVSSAGAVLPLQPLDDESARALINEATAAVPLRPQVTDAVISRAGGNPLFIEETLRNLRDHGDIDALPSSLEGMVAAQIDALSPLSRRVVRRAAVLGRSFRVGVLRDLFEDDEVALDDATQKELSDVLESDGEGRLKFRHALLRDAAYEGLPFRRRRQFHLAAAESTLRRSKNQPQEYADNLALHYWMGGDYPHTWQWARVAGDIARESYANVEAATQYTRALKAASHVDMVDRRDVLTVATNLGASLDRAGDYRAALRSYREAAAWVDSPVQRARLRIRRAEVSGRLGDKSIGLRDLAAAIRDVESSQGADADRVRAEALALRAWIYSYQGKFERTLAAAWEAESLAAAVHAADARARALDRIEMASRALGRTTGGVYAREALDLYRGLGDLGAISRVTNNLGAEAFFAGDWSTALSHYAEAATMDRRVGDLAGAAASDGNRAEILVLRGMPEEARDLLEPATKTLRAIGYQDSLNFANVLFGRALSMLGEHERAIDLLTETSRDLSASGEKAQSIDAAIALADAYVSAGRPDGALTVLTQVEGPSRRDMPVLFPTLCKAKARALAVSGDVDAALAACEEGRVVASDQDLPYDQAVLAILATRLSPLGHEGVSEQQARRAREFLEDLGVVGLDRLLD